MHERRFNVQQVDDNGGDGNDARIDCGGGPGGPAALGTPGDVEPVHGGVAAGITGAERGDGVHGAHRRLGHGEPRRPFFVAGPKEFVPGVSDEGVFAAFLIVTGECEWLVGNIAQFGCHRSRTGGNGDDISFGLRGWFLFVAAAADEEQAGGAGELVRLHDGEPMLPERPVDLVGGEPRLRNHIDDVGGIAFAPDGIHEMPFVVRIRRRDVTVESRLGT